MDKDRKNSIILAALRGEQDVARRGLEAVTRVSWPGTGDAEADAKYQLGKIGDALQYVEDVNAVLAELENPESTKAAEAMPAVLG